MKPLNLDITQDRGGVGHFLMGGGMAHVFFRSIGQRLFLILFRKTPKKILLGLYLSNISFSLKKNVRETRGGETPVS